MSSPTINIIGALKAQQDQRNPAFQTKLLLIAAALVNIVIAHSGPWRHVAHSAMA